MAITARPQSAPEFSGFWKQDNDRCQPRSNANVTLRIEQRDPELTVETSMTHGSQNPRRAVQRYTTDGKVSISTGIDGDEFHTSIVFSGQSLLFSIEEHEEGRIILSKETWTLIDDGAGLQRVRERVDGGEKQILVYRRESPQS
jgi:hypothetical protein